MLLPPVVCYEYRAKTKFTSTIKCIYAGLHYSFMQQSKGINSQIIRCYHPPGMQRRRFWQLIIRHIDIVLYDNVAPVLSALVSVSQAYCFALFVLARDEVHYTGRTDSS